MTSHVEIKIRVAVEWEPCECGSGINVDSVLRYSDEGDALELLDHLEGEQIQQIERQVHEQLREVA